MKKHESQVLIQTQYSVIDDGIDLLQQYSLTLCCFPSVTMDKFSHKDIVGYPCNHRRCYTLENMDIRIANDRDD